jgi:hypothetical protein
MIKRLDLTPALCAAIEAVRTAEKTYRPGGESASVVELPKLALANAVLDAVQQQTLARLPHRADRGIVQVRLTPIRRGRRA